MPLANIMLDLETWGVHPGSDIRSIGAVLFDPGERWVAEKYTFNSFYIACKNDGQYPLDRDPDTVEWWAKQSEDAQSAFAAPVDLTLSLIALNRWVGMMCKERDDLRIWSHGPHFDISIVEAAMRACGVKPYWHYRAARDTRTIIEAAGMDPHRAFDMFVEDGNVAHNALDDAIVQARTVNAAFAVLKSRVVETDVHPTARDYFNRAQRAEQHAAELMEGRDD